MNPQAKAKKVKKCGACGDPKTWDGPFHLKCEQYTYPLIGPTTKPLAEFFLGLLPSLAILAVGVIAALLGRGPFLKWIQGVGDQFGIVVSLADTSPASPIAATTEDLARAMQNQMVAMRKLLSATDVLPYKAPPPGTKETLSEIQAEYQNDFAPNKDAYLQFMASGGQEKLASLEAQLDATYSALGEFVDSPSDPLFESFPDIFPGNKLPWPERGAPNPGKHVLRPRLIEFNAAVQADQIKAANAGEPNRQSWSRLFLDYGYIYHQWRPIKTLSEDKGLEKAVDSLARARESWATLKGEDAMFDVELSVLPDGSWFPFSQIDLERK